MAATGCETSSKPETDGAPGSCLERLRPAFSGGCVCRLDGHCCNRRWLTARLQIFSVMLATCLLWIGLFLLFFGGFFFIQSGLVHAGMRAQLTHAVFNLFFLALTVMLVFSAAIILYGSLFRSDEVTHLLTTPATPERIVRHKFEETAFFSCWGFLLLASPMLLAYGLVVQAPVYYYVLLLPFILAFVLIPAGAGALIVPGGRAADPDGPCPRPGKFGGRRADRRRCLRLADIRVHRPQHHDRYLVSGCADQAAVFRAATAA